MSHEPGQSVYDLAENIQPAFNNLKVMVTNEKNAIERHNYIAEQLEKVKE